MSTGALASVLHENTNIFIKLGGAFGWIIIHTLIFLLAKCCFTCCGHNSRIDFIFSKDFERIFIGIVNYNEESYTHTFEYQMNK